METKTQTMQTFLSLDDMAAVYIRNNQGNYKGVLIEQEH